MSEIKTIIDSSGNQILPVTSTSAVFDNNDITLETRLQTAEENIENVNRFKGWFDDLTALQTAYATPLVGDYAYVKGATTSDPVDIYECATAGTWADSGRDVDTSNVQTFESSEQVNSVSLAETISRSNTLVKSSGIVAGIESSMSSPTNWPKIYTKDDYYYKGRINSSGAESSTGTIYEYIFMVSDYIRLDAIISSDYKMLIALYESYSSAITNSAPGRHYLKNVQTLGTRSAYNWNWFLTNTNYKNGYLAVRIFRQDSGQITDSDISTIESTLDLKFYQVEYKESLDSLRYKIELPAKDDFSFWIGNSSGGQSETPIRVKFLKENIPANTKIRLTINNLNSVISNIVWAMDVYRNVVIAVQGSSSGVIESGLIPNAWITPSDLDTSCSVSGVLCLYFKKSDNSSFTYNEILAIQENIGIELSRISSSVDETSAVTLPVGTFENTTTAIVSQPYITCVPYLGITYKFALPSGIKARFAHGTTSSISSATDWVSDGETVTLPATSMFHKLQVEKSDGSAITADTVSAYVSSGDMKVLYEPQDLPIEQRNYEAEKCVKAALYRLGWENTSAILAGQGLDSMPMIVQTSDMHGDVKRFENAAEYAGIIKADAIVSSGDNVLVSGSDGTGYLKDALSKHSGVPFITCIGNHEVSPAGTYSDNTYIFANHISPYISQGSYESVAGTEATAPYYFVDVDDKSIRMIVLNQFDSGCYYGEGCGGRLGQTQATWFCNTLLSTPQGYGVVIVMHSPEDKVNTPQEMSAWNQTVNWDGTAEDSTGYAVNGLYVNSIRPIKTIVDAFITRQALTTTYDENTRNGNNGETVTIDTDFSQVASGVEFICYLTGHRHKDNVGYLNTATNMQLVVNVVCGNCHYPRSSGYSFSEGCDIPRGDSGVTQDAFNVIAIDRQNGRVKIARVGSCINFEGIERKFLLAPYKSE